MKSATYGRVSQGFWALHKALDIVNQLGTPIVAPVAGKVTHPNRNLHRRNGDVSKLRF